MRTTKRKTQEEFIEEAKRIHKEKYDYNKVVYVNNTTKVCIVCPEHGEFWQTPKQHLRGQGCPLCGKKKTRGKTTKYDNSRKLFIKKKNENKGISCYKNLAFDTDIFIEFLKEIYGEKYNYDKVDYVNMKSKVTIVCPEHGDFVKTGIALLHKKTGCPQCMLQERSKIFSMGKDVFIEKSEKIHNNFYSYEEVDYINNSTPVKITCPKHGVFLCSPGNHLKGRGCPICKSEHFVYERRLYSFLLTMFKGEEIIRQYKPEWLTNRKSLDFYIPKYKIAIEHQGSQHFMIVKYFDGSDEKLSRIMQNDEEKIMECEKNNVSLLHFTYELRKKPDNCFYELFLKEDDLRDKINNLIILKKDE